MGSAVTGRPATRRPSARRAMRRGFVATALAVAGFMLSPGTADAAQSRTEPRRVIVAAFTDPVEENLTSRREGQEPEDGLLREFISLDMAAGLMSTSQGDYIQDQSVLDLSQGSRLPRAVYREDLSPLGLRESDGGWEVTGWDRVVDRARRASTTLRPGLLASSAGGAAYISPRLRPSSIGTLAAGSAGKISQVSLGAATSVVSRTLAAFAAGRPLVIVEMPRGEAGIRALSGLLRGRPASTSVLAIHLPPSRPKFGVTPSPGDRYFTQSAFGVSSDDFTSSSVGSATTRRPGLIASVDIAPTVLSYLGQTPPRSMRGQVVHSEAIEPDRLEQLRRRWSDVRSGRQGSSVRNLLLLGLGLWGAIGIVAGVRRALRPTLSAVGLALMWFPAVALGVAPLYLRTSSLEGMVIAGSALALGVASDRLVAWPRASFLPSAASLVVLAVDLVRGGPLLTASVLAPSVSSGNRFYGLSNEIEPLVPALVLFALAGVAPLLNTRARVATAYGLLGFVTAGLIGSGRLGADVGGVVTVAGAFTVGAFVALGLRASWKLAAAVVGLAVAAVGSLIAVDLLFGGQSHLVNNLTRLSSPDEFLELIFRRYQLAAHVALQPGNLISLVIAIAAVALVLRNREAFLPLIPSRPWLAALVGTLCGGLAGALSNDSGPVLLVNGVIAAAAGAIYLAGVPPSRLAVNAPEPTDQESAQQDRGERHGQ